MAKEPKSNKRESIAGLKLRNRVLLIIGFAFVVKLSIISRIQGFDWFAAGNGNIVNGLSILLDKNYIPAHSWYGADGENYIRGLLGLAKDGFLSTEGKLSYWPAGYPLLLWPILVLFKGSFFSVVSIFQSLLYAIACAFFIEEFRRTKLIRFTLPLTLILTFNPTLALNTIAIGYELPTVSFSLISTAAILRSFRIKRKMPISPELIVASVSFLLATFMQPRLILIAFVVLLIWAIAQYRLSMAALLLIVGVSIVSIAPATMIWRNSKANGYASISTNLGTTMGIGAGPDATGGYNGKYNGVPCPQADVESNPAKADNAKVKCILKWYVQNPGSSIKLFWNKARFFWSPWYGPEANGTMARNPWRINHPLTETVKIESGKNMVYGTFGKFVSWNWMLGTLILLFFGFKILWQSNGVERLLGIVALATVIINWVSSILTIGDHRFRIPSMGMSLLLQVIGFASLFIRARKRLTGSSAEVTWPGLRWKASGQTDNLPS